MTRSQPRDEAGESRGRLGRGGAARLLLVSDQPVLADLIALTLDHGRFAIKRADTAAAAATFLTRQVPQLVILDLDLEGVGGERVMERIGFPKLRAARVPVIALTRRGHPQTKLA